MKTIEYNKTTRQQGYQIKAVGTVGLGIIATRAFKPHALIIKPIGHTVPMRTELTVQCGAHIHFISPVLKYINHSCDPNCYFKIGSDDLPYLYAAKPIMSGEEITCDYESFEDEMIKPMTCRCGTSRCREIIKGWRFLSRENRERLRLLMADL